MVSINICQKLARLRKNLSFALYMNTEESPYNVYIGHLIDNNILCSIAYVLVCSTFEVPE